MSRINTVAHPGASVEWFQRNDEQVKAHPAWHFNISENDSETLLKGSRPFTYLLRAGQGEHKYFISFVKEDGSIKHQFFNLEYGDRKGWFYRNGGTGSPEEVVSQDLHQLIPMMMHCDRLSGTPLMSTYSRRG